MLEIMTVYFLVMSSQRYNTTSNKIDIMLEQKKISVLNYFLAGQDFYYFVLATPDDFTRQRESSRRERV